MSADPTDKPPEGEDFASMFAAAEKAAPREKRPKRAMGDRVRGRVVSIGHEVTVVELEGGGEGTIETLDLLGPEGQLTVKEGETIEARVVRMGEKAGFVWLRRGPNRGGDPHAGLAEA